jgi:hypothetical protein
VAQREYPPKEYPPKEYPPKEYPPLADTLGKIIDFSPDTLGKIIDFSPDTLGKIIDFSPDTLGKIIDFSARRAHNPKEIFGEKSAISLRIHMDCLAPKVLKPAVVLRWTETTLPSGDKNPIWNTGSSSRWKFFAFFSMFFIYDA